MTEKKWHALKDTPLPKLLHAIFLRGDSASALDITRGMLKRRIYFQNGWPVHVVSNSLSDVLGRVMMEEGIISQKDYEKSLEIALRQKKRHGEVLISLGLISQKGLDDCLALQMQKKIWRMFNWHDGEYKYFLIKGGLPANLQLLPMNPASLIIDGIAHGYCPFELAEAELKRFIDTPLVVSPNKPYEIKDLGFNTQQNRFLAAFNGEAKTKGIIDSSDLLHREAELLIYGLIITDILSPKEKTEHKGSFEETLKQEAHEEPIEKGAKEETYEAAQKMDAELLFQKGKSHLAAKDYEKAATEFEEITRLSPLEAEYKAYLGWALFNKDIKNAKRAKSLLMEALSINPDLDMAHLFLARLYLKEGLLKEAEGGLIAALAKNPFMPKAWEELTFIKISASFDIRKKGYVDYFHLTRNPFDPLPDPDFLYQGEAHSEALLFLLSNIKAGEGNIILLTGEKGSGKTSLCLKTMDALADEKVAFAYVDSPLKTGLDILVAIKNELGIKTSSDFAENVISALHAHCSMCKEAKGRTVVILDNAHNLSANALRGIKTLLQSGIDNIIISSLPEVENTLDEPHLIDIKQAVSGSHRIHPLGLEETRKYIFKRLAAADSSAKLEITPWAVKTIHNASLGNPEMTNKICDLSLDLAMEKKTDTIDEQIVRASESSIRPELDERLPHLEPVEEKKAEITEEAVRRIASEQIAVAVKEAVKEEFEKKAAQFDIAPIVKGAVEDAEKIFEQKAQQIIEQRIGALRKDLKSVTTIAEEPVEKAEEPTPGAEQIRQATSEKIIAAEEKGAETETVQHDTAFISFEADESRRGAFAKNGLLLKILILAAIVVVIIAAIVNYDILQKTDMFPTSSAPKPSQVKPVDLPKIEPQQNPPILPLENGDKGGFAPSAVEVQPEPESARPKEDKTSDEEEIEPVSAEPEEPPKSPKQESEIGAPALKSALVKPRLLTLTFEINGSRKETVFNGETFKIKKGDKVKIVSATTEGVLPKDVTVNLLGFVSNRSDNTGEDRGYIVDTAKDMWKKHSKGGKGKEFPIVVKHKGEKIGSIVLRLTD